MVEFVIPKHEKLGRGFSRAAQIQAQEHPGRQTNPSHGYQTPVAWLSDLLSLRRILILCTNCERHFDAGRFQYRVVYVPDWTGKTDGYTVNGKCDWCAQETTDVGGGKAFQPEEFYKATHMEPAEARRASRARAMSKRAWDAVQSEVSRRQQARA